MSHGLRIGHHSLDGNQMITALIRYRLLEPLASQLVLDEAIQTVSLSVEEVVSALSDGAIAPDHLATEDGSAGNHPDHPSVIDSHPESSHFSEEGSLMERYPLDSKRAPNSQTVIYEWCRRRNITPDYFNSVVLRDLRIQKFKQLRFADRIPSEFLKLSSELDQVEYSWVHCESASLAQELVFHLRDDGATFANVAATPGAIAGEWQGSAAQLPSEVAAVLQRGAEGRIHGPLTMANRRWIVRLERWRSAHLNAATRTLILNRLFNQWLQTQVKTLLAEPGAIAPLMATPTA
jgi:hypothetical protein